MFRSQCSTLLEKVKRARVSSFEELKSVIEESHADIISIDLDADINFTGPIDVGGKQVQINQHGHKIVGQGVVLFRNSKPTCVYTKLGLGGGSIELDGGQLFAGSGNTVHLYFNCCQSNSLVLKNKAMISWYGCWQQAILTFNANITLDTKRPILAFDGILILNVYPATIIKDLNDNELNWADVLSGIIRDADGKPRNILSNIVV